MVGDSVAILESPWIFPVAMWSPRTDWLEDPVDPITILVFEIPVSQGLNPIYAAAIISLLSSLKPPTVYKGARFNKELYDSNSKDSRTQCLSKANLF